MLHSVDRVAVEHHPSALAAVGISDPQQRVHVLDNLPQPGKHPVGQPEPDAAFRVVDELSCALHQGQVIHKPRVFLLHERRL